MYRLFLVLFCLSISTSASVCADEDCIVLRTSFRQNNGGLAFSPDGQYFAAAGEFYPAFRGHLTIWEIGTGEISARIDDFPLTCHGVDFHVDSNMVAVACANRSVYVFRYDRVSREGKWRAVAKLARRQPQPDKAVAGDLVRFSPDGTFLACTQRWPSAETLRLRAVRKQVDTIEDDLGIQLWQCETLKGNKEIRTVPFKTLPKLGREITQLEFRGDRLIAEGWDDHRRALYTLDTADGTVVSTLHLTEGGHSRTGPVRLSPDEKTIAVGDNGLIIYDAKTMSVRHRLPVPEEVGVRDIRYSPDSRLLASAWLGQICFWDVATGKLLASREAPNIRSIQFSPDGKLLAMGELPSPEEGVSNEIRLLKVESLLSEK